MRLTLIINELNETSERGSGVSFFVYATRASSNG